jgi:hypothetical protein
MSTITRRFSVTAARPRNSISRGSEDVVLGRATEWDGDGIQIELDARPVGAKGDHPLPGAPTLRQFDVVAGKRVPGPGLGVENVTKWIKVGFANDLGGYISVTIDSHPVGNWWDGKLRLFVQKPKKVK